MFRGVLYRLWWIRPVGSVSAGGVDPVFESMIRIGGSTCRFGLTGDDAHHIEFELPEAAVAAEAGSAIFRTEVKPARRRPLGAGGNRRRRNDLAAADRDVSEA